MKRLALPHLAEIDREHPLRRNLSLRSILRDHWSKVFAPPSSRDETVRIAVHSCCGRRAA